MTTDPLIDTSASSMAAADTIPLVPITRLLLTPNEAAAALRISPRLLWSKTKIGEIACVRIGKCVRYDPRSLLRFLDAVATET